MEQGTIKFFNATKGYGFITPDNGSPDIFVHATGLIDDVRMTDKVTYELKEGKTGPNAINVRKIESPQLSNE